MKAFTFNELAVDTKCCVSGAVDGVASCNLYHGVRTSITRSFGKLIQLFCHLWIRGGNDKISPLLVIWSKDTDTRHTFSFCSIGINFIVISTEAKKHVWRYQSQVKDY
ncbi:unnamed protein product [Vicia faba]|uniref:Uncharacterized protein n=1 Tax=Vicia faba TaxID=3906 RepID=A0AAV1AV81_VICFA|nr:unnamed protein product [Vicia faba]